MLPDELLNDPDFKVQALERLRQQNVLGEIEIEAAKRQQAVQRATGDARGQFTYTGPIMEDGVHTFIGLCDNWCARNPGRPIEILLNSPGGSVTDGLAFIDYLYLLRKRGHHIKIIGTGMVASMAGVILQAANERALTSRAYFGMHEVSSYVGGTTTQQEDALKFTKQLQQRCVDMLVHRSTMTPAKLRTMWKRKDIWCDAQKALALGVIDTIEDTEPDAEAP